MHSSRMRTVRSSGRRVGVVSHHALGRGCVYPSMHWAGGVCWGVSAQVHTGIHPPVDRMTDACENITLPQPRRGR